MKRLVNRILLLSTITFASMTVAQAKDRPLLVAQDIGAFDGKAWSNLTIGATTFSAVRQQFETGKSDFRNATQLTQSKGSPLRIDALWNGKGKDAVLTNIVLRYTGSELDLDAVKKSAAVPAQALYQSERSEDWRLVIFPKKGIVAFVLRDMGQDRVPLVVLSPPPSLTILTVIATASPQPVIVRTDPHAGEPRIMEFGTVAVNVNLRGQLTMEEKERRDAERSLQESTARGTMRYQPGASGSYIMDIDGGWTPKEGGSVTVTCRITGSSPYGPVSASGSSSQSWPKVRKIEDMYYERQNTAYTIALFEARNKAESSFAATMKSQGPPPVEQLREQAWSALIDSLRK